MACSSRQINTMGIKNRRLLKMYTEINKCRVCSSSKLNTVLSLGEQYLTGVFPKSIDDEITKGPLELVFCSQQVFL